MILRRKFFGNKANRISNNDFTIRNAERLGSYDPRLPIHVSLRKTEGTVYNQVQNSERTNIHSLNPRNKGAERPIPEDVWKKMSTSEQMSAQQLHNARNLYRNGFERGKDGRITYAIDSSHNPEETLRRTKELNYLGDRSQVSKSGVVEASKIATKKSRDIRKFRPLKKFGSILSKKV